MYACSYLIYRVPSLQVGTGDPLISQAGSGVAPPPAVMTHAINPSMMRSVRCDVILLKIKQNIPKGKNIAKALGKGKNLNSAERTLMESNQGLWNPIKYIIIILLFQKSIPVINHNSRIPQGPVRRDISRMLLFSF